MPQYMPYRNYYAEYVYYGIWFVEETELMSMLDKTWTEDYAPPTGWRLRLLKLRFRFAIWRAVTFRLFKPPIINAAGE